MEKCSCYHETHGAGFGMGRGVCYGTRECEYCWCDGDESKCDFYPEKRKKANKELNTAEMWLAAQIDGETYKTDFCDTSYSKEEGFFTKDKTAYFTTPSLNDWMNAMWRKQEKRKLTKEEAEKEFDIKIID